MKLDARNRSNQCLFVQWTRPVCRYMLVARGKTKPRILAEGAFETSDTPSFAELCEHLKTKRVRFRQAVVLLPRADVDVVALQLPPASEAELPELVANAIAQEADDLGKSRLTDFVVTHNDEDICETLAFSYAEQSVDRLRSALKQAGGKLISVTFCGYGAVELLKQVSIHPASTAVVVTRGDHDTELAVEVSGRPLLFRTIPNPNEEDTELVARRLGDEIRRTLALAHRADDDSTRLYVIGTVDAHEQIARVLNDQMSVSVSLIDPLDQVEASIDVESPSRYANLIGTACAWNRGSLELDLVNPRRPPARQTPVRRMAFWGAIAASVALTLGYFAWQDRVEQAGAITAKEEKLSRLALRAKKALQLQDAADAVQAWREDDVIWLDELRDLSDRLPSQEQALIRQMGMSTDPQRNGVIDLAVQVSSPDVVAELENAVRDDRHSVSSKRVSESATQLELPWQFETRIVFSPEEPPDLPAVDDVEDLEEPQEKNDAPAKQEPSGLVLNSDDESKKGGIE